MKLYHGSRENFTKLKRKKAWNPPGTPPEEGLSGIYLTPDFPFALVSGARPLGITTVNHRDRTIKLENPLNKDLIVYIYIVNSEKIPSDKLKWIDEYQAVVDLDEIEPDEVETHTAREVSKYYTIL